MRLMGVFINVRGELDNGLGHRRGVTFSADFVSSAALPSSLNLFRSPLDSKKP